MTYNQCERRKSKPYSSYNTREAAHAAGKYLVKKQRATSYKIKWKWGKWMLFIVRGKRM